MVKGNDRDTNQKLHIKIQSHIIKKLSNMIYYDEGRRHNMANVFDAAIYILEQSGAVSVMKLQKLCYYAQAWSLVWDDYPLFSEEFHAWANGPVCPELFYKTKGKYLVSVDDETGGNGNLTDNQKDTIDKVLEYYGRYDAQWLSQLTQMEEPWRKAREGVPAGGGCNKIITKESMAMYYGGL